METTSDIEIHRTAFSQIDAVDWNNLQFGKHISDHMFVCDFAKGEWQTPQIVPFQDLALSPATLALHYGQSIFEGMKAFRMEDGRINIFRIDTHWERLNRSLQRMCMPEVPEYLFKSALEQLVHIDKQWVPHTNDSALYIRPFVFASEARYGVKVSDEYKFIIFTGPVPILYQKPIKVKVERKYIRAAKGGTGSAKCCGNYGGAFYPTHLARQEGYDQVLWTDASNRDYIEESGTMNVMFVINNTLITAPLSDTILDGITRDSLLAIAKDLGLSIEERPVGIKEFISGLSNGTITELFGAGTAAVIAPISTVGIDGKDYLLPTYSENHLMFQLKNKLERIRRGIDTDVHGWNYVM